MTNLESVVKGRYLKRGDIFAETQMTGQSKQGEDLGAKKETNGN